MFAVFRSVCRVKAVTRVQFGNMSSHAIVMDSFALRQFGESSKKCQHIEMSPEEFEKRVNEYIEANGGLEACLKDGYAPFCKHVFVPNFVAGLKTGALAITEETQPFLRSDYVARRAEELPVLSRWFERADVAHLLPEATYLDVILYSREQIRKEQAALPDATATEEQDAPWGIISIKAQHVDHELPMEPITVMRNALGREYGGSGVPIQEAAYRASVDFWKTHARVA
ncbi:MAG: hypothetical protein MHM6MM_005214 [Cercozoa sp. M6MM]